MKKSLNKIKGERELELRKRSWRRRVSLETLELETRRK